MKNKLLDSKVFQVLSMDLRLTKNNQVYVRVFYKRLTDGTVFNINYFQLDKKGK